MSNATNNTSSRGSHAEMYPLDNLFVTLHRSVLGTIWRWRSEVAVSAVLVAALVALSFTRPACGLAAALAFLFHVVQCPLWVSRLIWGIAELAVALGALLAVPVTRSFIVRHAWCVISRHRFQRLCWEARLHTRAGKLPPVLWVRPTKVGERLYVWCLAGIAAEDFAKHTGELRAACYARDARVIRNERWSQLTIIDVIRRDTLAASATVASPLRVLVTQSRPPASVSARSRPAWPGRPRQTVKGEVLSK